MFQSIQITHQHIKNVINKTASALSNELAECVALGVGQEKHGLDCSQQIIIVTYPVDI